MACRSCGGGRKYRPKESNTSTTNTIQKPVLKKIIGVVGIKNPFPRSRNK